MKKLFIVFLFAFAALSCSDAKTSVSYGSVKDRDTITAEISGHNFKFFAVKSPEAKAQGLSGRKAVPEDGMIFFFDAPQNLTFWMKDMLFAIDIVWVKGDRIVSVTKNLMPEPGVKDIDLKLYNSIQYADIAIELTAGDIDKYNIQPGQKIMFKKESQNDR